MLKLRNLDLVQFKNYASHSFSFKEQVIAVTGLNGIGKTNLLDAIYYLCFTRSYFSTGDAVNSMQGTSGFRISGSLSVGENSTQVSVLLRETGKKEVLCDGIQPDKMADHLGKFPAVMIAPDDIELITGGSELRRKQIDALLCQLDSDYLSALISYNKFLQQRNSYLRQTADGSRRNDTLLDVLDERLMASGNILFEKRKVFLPLFIEKTIALYKHFAEKEEHISIQYESALFNHSFEQLLQSNREKDYILQRTTSGIHRDNLVFSIRNTPFKSMASQGQRKSLLFALKLAEAEILKSSKGFSPILLLDDVFEKLDAARMQQLLEYVCKTLCPQLFLTDTHPERVQEIFNRIEVPYQKYNLETQ
jgi:DNA replication and repair protein RecF